jgi:methionyl aminopeptidase
VNDVVVHGVPSSKVVLKKGDLVKVDVVGSFNGYCADMARCFFVGEATVAAKKIAATARYALDKAIEIIKPGIHLSDISALIQKEVEKEGFGVVRNFAGHGIGKSLHEEPEIPNFGKKGNGPLLRSGMTLAIEPMITEFGYEVKIDSDGWTARTADGGLAGHVEDTILVTEKNAEILTKI